MKKLIHNCNFLRVLLLALLSLVSNGQQYAKIPIDTNYYWRQFSICPNYDYQLSFVKDTTIGGKIYNQYSTFGRTYGPGFCSSLKKTGFLRQDTIGKSVVILDENFVERPLYNFSKVLGDTLLSYDVGLKVTKTLTVTNITTAVLNDGSTRKAMWLSNVNCLIEGVGSAFGGLFGCNQPFQSSNQTEELICFGKRNPFSVLMEGKTTLGILCGLVPVNVDIDEINAYTGLVEIGFSPNPVVDKFRLQFQQGSSEIINLSISDLHGRVVLLINGPKQEQEFDISFLPKGVYFVRVKSPTKQKALKLLKE